jgi:hypothetical protein
LTGWTRSGESVACDDDVRRDGGAPALAAAMLTVMSLQALTDQAFGELDGARELFGEAPRSSELGQHRQLAVD